MTDWSTRVREDENELGGREDEAASRTSRRSELEVVGMTDREGGDGKPGASEDAGRTLLDAASIQSWLEGRRWFRDGDALVREWVFRDFGESLGFVNRVGALAEAAGHHPDIDIRWNRVRLVLSTHSAGGLTRADLELAGQIDSLG